MKKSMVLAGAALAVGFTAAASADLVVEIGGPFVFSGPEFITVETTPLVGTLTGINIIFSFSNAVGASWVSDLVVGVNGVGFGGFNTGLGLTLDGDWAGTLPGTGAAGDYVGKQSFSVPQIFDGETATILIGNGWTSLAGGFTIDNVSVVLKGVDKIPAPGALALLGLAGLAGSRRRRA